MMQRKKYIPFLEIPLVEQCNLNCANCNSHANYVSNSPYDLDQFKRDIDVVSRNVHFGIITFLGGEPLLCKKINEYIKYARDKNIAEVYRVLTNGILLDKMDDAFYDIVDVVEVSHYPEVKMSVEGYNKYLRDKSRDHHFRYYVKDIKMFNKVDTIEISKDEAQEGYLHCSRIKDGNMIFNGYYYKCMRPKTTNLYLSKEYGMKLEHDLRVTDGIKIEDDNFLKRLNDYLDSKVMLESCQYCLMGLEKRHESIINMKHLGYSHPWIVRLFYKSNFIYYTYKKLRKLIQSDEGIETKSNCDYMNTNLHSVERKG